ncbi:uncharacterized protein N0V89_009791 [Didymosphaeria variabile]|uniref:Uncharacterized protein n=1 Tax=Didymosphaeria variabile TaxID=1932322 RepID=A0A9W9C6W6_9PLEO|nr:uncharacterized protein N0V89_009791 [Didymosphaeria variabile]KAJ4348417.1 hypothetical protein N0V89_009791 [Didymosphaeria variabile]
MADDTREPSAPTPPPPRAPANIMPGGTAHTAGGQKADDNVSYVDVVRNLPADYYLNFYKRPGCDVKTGNNLFELCGSGVYYRRKEKDGMKQAQELMEKKRATIEAKKEARRKQREEQDKLEEARRLEEQRRKSWGHWFDKNVRFW